MSLFITSRLPARLLAFALALAGLGAINVATAPPAAAYTEFVYNMDSPTTNHGVFFTDVYCIERILYAGQSSYSRYGVREVRKIRLKATTCAIVKIRPITGGTFTEYIPKGGVRNIPDGMSIDVDPRTSPC